MSDLNDEVRRPGHRLLSMSASGVAECECGRVLRLSAQDLANICRRRTPITDALLDAHNLHLASMEEQGR